MMKNDAYWMNQCIQLARHGVGMVSPNPLVGAVIVKNGVKIGEGFHECFGAAHAEVNAINDALSRKKTIIGSTIYVNLEPCYHFGKTPPCVDALIRHGISRVVIAISDPNPRVSGRGIEKLRKKGISVKKGILKNESEKLNEKFLQSITAKRPFIALKAAQTSDGFIAHENGDSKWITNDRSRAHVHQLRNEYDAVLVGAQTVIQDDPELTVRAVSGRNPIRVILDGKFTVPIDRKIFNRESATIMYISDEAGEREHEKMRTLTALGVNIVAMKSKGQKLNLRRIIEDLHERNIGALLIEGGAHIYSEFMNRKLVDKLYLFTSPKIFHVGIKTFNKISVSYRKKQVAEQYFRNDRLQEFRITFP